MLAGPISRRRISQRGFTLLEVLVSTGLAAMLSLACITSFVHLLKGQRSLSNYIEMNSRARGLLERMGQDFRATGDVPAGGFDASSITVLLPSEGGGWTSVTWSYDADTQMVVRVEGSVITTYAVNVSNFSFTYLNTSGGTPSNDIEIKQVQLTMRILSNSLGITTSEYVISAQFTLRAKPTTV